MKKLIPFIFACMIFSCQKEELPSSKEGRSIDEEQQDSASVTPTLDTNGWEGAIDVGFEFG